MYMVMTVLMLKDGCHGQQQLSCGVVITTAQAHSV